MNPRSARLVPPQARRWVLRLSLVLLVVSLCALSWWAGRTVLWGAGLTHQADESAIPSSAVTQTGSVGRSLTLPVSVRQPRDLVAVNLLPGVVTEARPDQRAVTGEALYAVDGVSVRAIRGNTPFYRDLERGLSGPDVWQLSEALTELGHTWGPRAEFDPELEQSLRWWQQRLGVPETGRVLRGELVAFKTLPVTVWLGPELLPGRLLTGGEEAVFAPSGSIRTELVVSALQDATIPSSATVVVDLGQERLSGRLGDRKLSDDGLVRIAVVAQDGSSFCGQECNSLPTDENLTLQAQVQTVPNVTGIVVPTAAIRTSIDGATYAMTPSGKRYDVSVLASAGGLSVVEGIPENTLVELTDG